MARRHQNCRWLLSLYSNLKRTREQAQASREQAQEMARFYAAKNQENQLYGLSVSYQKEYADIHRKVREADLAEVSAKEKMAQASKAVLAADIAESQGKTNLLSSLNQISVANKEVSFTARAAAVSTNLMKSALALLGGPVGLSIMAAVAGATALYTAFQKGEAETKAYTAALQKSGLQAIMTVNDLRMLTMTLGGTENAVKAVTSAAGAGFGGNMLSDIAETGTRMNELGMSSDDLVSTLSSLSGEPLKAMEALTNQGVQLNTTFIDHIATLSRQGKTSEATALLQQKYLDDVKAKVAEQENSVGGLASIWKSLKDEVASAFDVIGQAHMKTGQAQALAQGVKLDISNDTANEVKKTNEELYKRRQQEQEAARKELKLQNEVSAAIKAGADPKKEQARLTGIVSAQFKAGKLTADEYAQALKGINKQYGEKSKGTAYSDSEGVRRLQQLQQQSSVLRAQAQDTDKLTESQKKLVAFDQEIAGLQGKKLTASQKSLLSMQDQIRAQLTENVALEKTNREREIGKKLSEQTHSLVMETAAKQQEYANRNAQLTMSTDAYDQMVAEQQIRQSFQQHRLQLDKEVTDKTSEQYIQQTAILASEQQRQLDVVRNAAQEKAAIEGDYTAGLKKGMMDWSSDAGNVYGQVKDATTRTFDGMTSMLTNFVTTGKASFSDFAKSVLTDLSSMMIKMAMFNALKADKTALNDKADKKSLGSAAGATLQSGLTDATPGRVATVGAFGVGIKTPTQQALDGVKPGGLYSAKAVLGGIDNNSSLLQVPFDANTGYQIIIPTTLASAPKMYLRLVTTNPQYNGQICEVITTSNTTTDANGFIKKASPIARVSDNPENMTDNYLDGFVLSGLAAVNQDATGVSAEKIDTGIYVISGAVGLAKEGWDFEIPQDSNGNRLCFVTTEVNDNGEIIVRVSKRKVDFETATVIAGEPMDIPAGRWIDFRLEMPIKDKEKNK